jgi:hypothetical protein
MSSRRRVPQHKLSTISYRNLHLGEYTNQAGETRPASVFEATCAECGEWYEQVRVLSTGEATPVINLGDVCKRCPACRK